MALIKTMQTQRSTEEQDMKQYETGKEERMCTFKRLVGVGKSEFFFYSENGQETGEGTEGLLTGRSKEDENTNNSPFLGAPPFCQKAVCTTASDQRTTGMQWGRGH